MIPDGKINGPWELHGYSDTDYTGDIDTQKSVTVYLVLINIAVITWISGIQKTVTLSFTESEYSEITEVCCKILVFCEILLFMGVVGEYPITVHVDNVGAIFLPESKLCVLTSFVTNLRIEHLKFNFFRS